MSVPPTDDILDAIYRALEKFEREEKRVADKRQFFRDVLHQPGPTRVHRSDRGEWIPAPRRSALARYLTDAVLTALREDES